ncbi:unnamed protein product, partial [Ectocarpus fasciculatus]
MFENCGYASGIGNGWCDNSNNKEECGYDGGDCCSCTCQSNRDDDYYYCGESAYYNCKDPSAACFGEETAGDDDVGFDDDDRLMPMSSEFSTWEEAELLPTVADAVEVGTKTEVSVSA